jgi:hypothetical protein
MARAVMRLDPAALRSAEDVRALLACVPSPEEGALFGAFLRSGGDAAALSDAERFCLALLAVRRCCFVRFTGQNVSVLLQSVSEAVVLHTHSYKPPLPCLWGILGSALRGSHLVYSS